MSQWKFLALNIYTTKIWKINGRCPPEDKRKQNKSKQVRKRKKKSQAEINKIGKTFQKIN